MQNLKGLVKSARMMNGVQSKLDHSQYRSDNLNTCRSRAEISVYPVHLGRQAQNKSVVEVHKNQHERGHNTMFVHEAKRWLGVGDHTRIDASEKCILFFWGN
jgi:hypothetical protein